MTMEKIYGIMITGKYPERERLARLSAQCFNEQVYSNKELLVINDGDYTLSDIAGVRELRVPKQPTLGHLRNIALDELQDDALWIQWDDDDYYHVSRLSYQSFPLQQYPSMYDGVVLLNQIRYDFQTGSAWVHTVSKRIPGTILCRNKPDARYPQQARDEDSLFWREYNRKYRLLSIDNPDWLYIRFIHDNNTWDRAHFNIPDSGEWHLGDISRAILKNALREYDQLEQVTA